MIRACAPAALLTGLSLGGALALSSCTLLPPAPPVDDYIGRMVRPAERSRPGGPATAPSPTTSTQAPSSEPLALTVGEAILVALDRNQALSVQRLDPSIRRTVEQEERAAFDADVTAGGSYSRRRQAVEGDGHTVSSNTGVDAAVSQPLPTGTDVSVGITADLLTSSLRDDQYVTGLGLTVNQALLRGAGLDVNLAAVRQARLDTLASEYELRGFAEALVAQVEETYWDCALAQRTIEIVTNSLHLAEQQVQETQKRIRVGSVAETESAAAEAELARRRENLINARSHLATTRLALLRLLNPLEKDFWNRDLVLRSAPSPPQANLDDVETYVQVALRMRPELNQARLGVQRDDLELVRTRNGLLPRMDLFVTLGKTGFANSFGRSVDNLFDENHDLLAGVRFEYPPRNRSSEARHQRAVYSRDQALRAVENLAQLVQVDVRSAYIEVNRAQEQVAATAATRRLQEETLRVETEKFRVGRSTSLLVAQAQRDLLESQIGEVAAVVAHLKALTQLHLQQGALLERRGIAAPGATPVDLSAPRRW